MIIYYLIISYYHGGTVAIPEPTQQECVRLRDWIVKREQANGNDGSLWSAYCLPGLPLGAH